MADPATPVGPERETPLLGIPSRGVPPTDSIGYRDLVALGKLRPFKILDVREFGASGDGNHDDAPAIARAIAALPPAGGIVYLPAGNYKLGSTVTISGRSGVWIVGQGWAVTTVTRAGTTGNAFRFTANSDSGAVRDMAITRSTGATTGAAIRADATGGASSGGNVMHVTVTNFFDGLMLVNVTDWQVYAFRYTHSESPSGSPAAITVDGAGEHFFDNVKRGGDPASSNAIGLRVVGTTAFVQGIRLSNFSFIGTGDSGIVIDGGANGGAYINIVNGDIGEMTNYGVRLMGTMRAVHIANVNMINCGANGFLIEGSVSNSSLVGCKVRGGQTGYNIAGQSILVSGCIARACNPDGFFLNNASNHVVLTGNRAHECIGNGCEVMVNTDFYIIVANNFIGNSGTDFVDNGIAPKVVAHNLS